MTKRELKYNYWYPISVSIERLYKKGRKRVNNWYRAQWLMVFVGFIMVLIGICFISVVTDLKIYRYNKHFNNQIELTLDVPFTEIYTNWRTDGSPGQDPPER